MRETNKNKCIFAETKEQNCFIYETKIQFLILIASEGKEKNQQFINHKFRNMDRERVNRIYDKTGGYCHLCNKKLSRTNYGVHGAKGSWHVDHSKAKANGGTHHLNNLFPACISCNIEKGTLHKSTIRKRKGYQTGSSSSGCYITTACVTSKGLSDNCYELQVLRMFRDTYVASQPNGQELINEYYRAAPLIVESINRLDNVGEVYETVFHNIKKAVGFIEQKEDAAAFALYCDVVKELNEKYNNASTT